MSFVFGPLRSVSMGLRLFTGVVTGVVFMILQNLMGAGQSGVRLFTAGGGHATDRDLLRDWVVVLLRRAALTISGHVRDAGVTVSEEIQQVT